MAYKRKKIAPLPSAVSGTSVISYFSQLAQAAHEELPPVRQVLAEAPGPIHPVILLKVPSVTLVPVFLPVLLVTLEVPLPLLFLSVLPLLSLLLLLVLAPLSWAPSSSMWHRLAYRPLGHRLGAKS